MAKMNFVLEILLVCFQAMKESGLHWSVVSEDEQERQMQRLVASIKFADDLNAAMWGQALQQYVDDHPEKYLFAYVHGELAAWLVGIPVDLDHPFRFVVAGDSGLS